MAIGLGAMLMYSLALVYGMAAMLFLFLICLYGLPTLISLALTTAHFFLDKDLRDVAKFYDGKNATMFVAECHENGRWLIVGMCGITKANIQKKGGEVLSSYLN